MPVRRIPKNYLGVTGGFASRKNGRGLGFEFLLERDYMILLEFDETVERFEEQPVRIPVPGSRKGAKSYVPDVLVQYIQSGPDSKPKPRRPRPLLVEVKHTSHLKRYEERYRPKFKAARKYAKERDWEFRIVTEKEIRGPFLENLKFLREYVHVQPDLSAAEQVIQAVRDAGGRVEFGELLGRLCRTDDEQMHIVPVIWHLVITHRLKADLSQPLGWNTMLSVSARRVT